MSPLNLARGALVILATISFFVSCAQMTLRDVGKLRQGMTVQESQMVTNISPKYTFSLDTIEGDGPIEVHSYILTSGDYRSNYFLVYRDGQLMYWGYPHEFARSKDPLLKEIGRKAVKRLEQLELSGVAPQKVWKKLNTKVLTLYQQGRYSEAAKVAEEALSVAEKTFGPDHPAVAISLNNLAGLYDSQGRYGEAEPLYKRALAIAKKAFGPDHPNVAACLNNLAELYRAQGKYAEAERLYIRALKIGEKALGPDHPNVAMFLGNLATVYQAQGKYAEAEPPYKRALTIMEKSLGPDHPHVATSLNNLGEVYRAQGRYSEAEPLHKQALTIREKALGKNHPDVAQSLNNLALLYQAQGRYTEAEPLY
ncbi:MAG: tetratricopeptide repeat protein, partial [Methanomassiliicoccales archaeon]